MRMTLVALVALSLAACSKSSNRNAQAADADAQAAASNAGAAARNVGAAAVDATTNTANAMTNGVDTAANDAPATDQENAAMKDTHRQDQPMAQGANSFTHGEARAHIEHAGYADVSDLRKDPNGVWRGKAVRGGHPVDVAVDFKGDVTSQ